MRLARHDGAALHRSLDVGPAQAHAHRWQKHVFGLRDLPGGGLFGGDGFRVFVVHVFVCPGGFPRLRSNDNGKPLAQAVRCDHSARATDRPHGVISVAG
ncbi:hypothetical protein D9M68_973450 [compost metagenome]